MGALCTVEKGVLGPFIDHAIYLYIMRFLFHQPLGENENVYLDVQRPV